MKEIEKLTASKWHFIAKVNLISLFIG
jgi:hypothetical protein